MREIVLDTETTGLDPADGHRLVELGCVELLNHVATGRTFHVYVNPERDMPAEAFAVHGLSAEFLRNHPTFAAVVMDFLAFVGDAPLVIHNAAFDMRFLNAELARLGKPPFPHDRAIDTLALSRRKHPAGPHSLDQLCSRYGIDNSKRTKHGALLDSELLAEVYLELCGGRQPGLILAGSGTGTVEETALRAVYGSRPEPLASRISPDEQEAHQAFVATLGAEPLWRKYEGREEGEGD